MKKQKAGKPQVSGIEELLVYKHLDNSYKIFWIQGIVNEVMQGNKKITFSDIGIQMVAGAWDMVLDKGITFGRLDKLYRAIEDIEEIVALGTECTQEEIIKELKGLNQKELHQIMCDIYEETPYTFLAPCYEGQLKGKTASKRLPAIEELVNADAKAIYKIDSTQKFITVNGEWANLIKNNKASLDAIIKDTLAFYLDRNAGKRVK